MSPDDTKSLIDGTIVSGAPGSINATKMRTVLKAVVDAIVAAVASKADLDSAVFTDMVEVPTAAPGTNNNTAASTAFVATAVAGAYQPLDADLTTWAGLTPSANAQSLVTAANYAAMRALLDLEVGTDFLSPAAIAAAYQPLDADLTSWAGVTRAAGFDTFAATPSSANLKTLVSDETGSGALVFGTSPSFTTGMTLGSGFVIDWAGDVSLTHSANTLTFAGAASGYVFDNGLTVNLGANPLMVKAASGGDVAAVRYNTTNATESVGFGFQDNSSTKWTFYKGTDQSLHVYDFANSVDAIALTAGSAAASFITLGSTKAATSTSSAALVVSGGLGVAGSIYAGTGLVKTAGKETIWIPVQAMVARTTNGAASGTVESSTNKNIYKTLDFDTTTQEFAQFFVKMPKSWNKSTVTATFTWSHASTTTNFGVVWALEAVAFSDADAGDAAPGTAQQIADTGGTTSSVYVTGATPAITIAGSPAAEDWVLFQVKRVPADGSDTMAIDARLHGVTLYITTDAATDA